MKKEYTAPEVEISVFSTEDVITLSNGVDYNDGDNYGDLFG